MKYSYIVFFRCSNWHNIKILFKIYKCLNVIDDRRQHVSKGKFVLIANFRNYNSNIAMKHCLQSIIVLI